MNAQNKAKPVVLITGASSGIGRAAARRLAKAGFRVFGTSRQKSADDAGIEMIQLDVRGEESVRQGVAQVLERAGRIDVLVNNAGVMHMGIAEDTSIEEARGLRDQLPRCRARDQRRPARDARAARGSEGGD